MIRKLLYTAVTCILLLATGPSEADAQCNRCDSQLVAGGQVHRVVEDASILLGVQGMLHADYIPGHCSAQYGHDQWTPLGAAELNTLMDSEHAPILDLYFLLADHPAVNFDWSTGEIAFAEWSGLSDLSIAVASSRLAELNSIRSFAAE